MDPEEQLYIVRDYSLSAMICILQKFPNDSFTWMNIMHKDNI
jgi:hypothetical protein